VKNITTVLTTLQFHQSISPELLEGEPTSEKAREWLEHMAWPNTVTAPVWLTQIMKVAGEKKQASKAADKKQHDDSAAFEKAEKLLAEMETALDEGHASDAAQALKQLNKVTNDLNRGNAHKINGPLRLLMNRLNELRDWQGFAVTPKKEALCEQMEGLIDSEQTPDVVADRIKELQDEWKALGHSNDRDLWQRFQNASDKAFEPCKVYFAEQAEHRAKLVAMRKALIEELVRYEQEMDWETADWKVVQNTLNAARDAFNTYSPVDRHSHQRTQKEFRAVCDAIYAHIKAEYDRNLEAKRALVEAAKEASTAEDISAAADVVKKLQQDWKAIGPTPRGPDQRLWQDLRKYADSVFARMSEARDARKSEIDETVSKAEALVSNAEAAVANDDMALIKQARTDIDAMDLPKGAHIRLTRALAEFEQQIQARKHAAVEAKAKGRWDTLQAALVNSVSEGSEAPQQGDLPNGIDATWFTQDKSADVSASELCIAMEILADIESPESDQQARMSVQVKRLAEGLGKGRSKDEERSELVKQWLTADADKALAERFVKALAVTI
jgi:exonuclease SbcC